MPLVIAQDVSKIFAVRSRSEPIRAVDGVSMHIERGETLALVGESGSGKSTFARCLVGLLQPTDGIMRIAGADPYCSDKRERLAARRQVQIVFQDPGDSLDPTMNIKQILCEPLVIQKELRRADRKDKATELLEQVHLRRGYLERRPWELSGGEQQRVAIARAISTNPAFLVLDEPVSSVDFAVRNQLLALLRELQVMHGLTYLFITHDLVSAQQMARRTAVMYAGKIVETGLTDDVLQRPRHSYTRLLVDSVLRTPGAAPPQSAEPT